MTLTTTTMVTIFLIQTVQAAGHNVIENYTARLFIAGAVAVLVIVTLVLCLDSLLFRKNTVDVEEPPDAIRSEMRISESKHTKASMMENLETKSEISLEAAVSHHLCADDRRWARYSA